MSLYIANTTKQHFIHCFRTPESSKVMFVDIPSGKQRVIGQHWNALQTESAVHYLESFGGRPARDAHGKLDEFPGILYSTDKPITEDQIESGHEALVDAQEKRSIKEAVRSAQAFDIATRDRGGKGKRLASVTEVEVTEDVPRHQKPTGKEVKFKLAVAEGGDSDKKLMR